MVEVDSDANGAGTRSVAKTLLRAVGSHMSFQGKTVVDLAATTNSTAANAIRMQIAPLWSGAGQTVFCLSLHYDYGAINGHSASSSAHSVDFMHSSGGPGNRQAGFRFFDPNIGSWRFQKADQLLNFFCDDWLHNFFDNTMKADPITAGQSASWKGPRTMTGFRLIRFVVV
ncbi:hypothetical protein [Fuscibacter oryzae]|uniref:Uncharacterized protein n=1 Tax=Fuscibacter oryzae TaxID=2803939 RepID=A0A8J7MUM3_9RHOB|nr:hypothetical protein [Fuscibacter oryzae]MBL4927739.1 hypothetical protein [Fuscibacter oryzae]